MGWLVLVGIWWDLNDQNPVDLRRIYGMNNYPAFFYGIILYVSLWTNQDFMASCQGWTLPNRGGSISLRLPTTWWFYLQNQQSWDERSHSTGPSSIRCFHMPPLEWARCGWPVKSFEQKSHEARCPAENQYMAPEESMGWCWCISYRKNPGFCCRWMVGNTWTYQSVPRTWACNQVITSAQSFVPHFGEMADKGGKTGGISDSDFFGGWLFDWLEGVCFFQEKCTGFSEMLLPRSLKRQG